MHPRFRFPAVSVASAVPVASLAFLLAAAASGAASAAAPAGAPAGGPQGCSGGDEGALTWLGLPSDHAVLQAVEKSLWFCENGGFGFDLATLHACLLLAIGGPGSGSCP